MNVLQNDCQNLEENKPKLMVNNVEWIEDEIAAGNEGTKNVGEESDNMKGECAAALTEEDEGELEERESESEQTQSLTQEANLVIDTEEHAKEEAEKANESAEEALPLTLETETSLEGEAETLEGEAETLEGETETLEGEAETLEGETETLEGEKKQQKEEVKESDSAEAKTVINETERGNADISEKATEVIQEQSELPLYNGNSQENNDQFLDSSLEPSDEQVIYDGINLENRHEIAKCQAKDKFKTIRFIPRGNTGKRVALFENMKTA